MDAITKHVPVSPLTLLATIFVVVILAFRTLINLRRKRLDYPVIEVDQAGPWKDAIIEASKKYPDSPFVIPDTPPMIMLPIGLMDEVRNLPQSTLSFSEEVMAQFCSKVTSFAEPHPILKMIIRDELTRNMGSSLDEVTEEIRYAMDLEIGPCEDWTSFNLYQKIARIVAYTAGRIFVGPSLSRQKEWVDGSIEYTVEVHKARDVLIEYPRWTHPIIAPFLPQVKQIKKRQKLSAELIKPHLARIEKSEKSQLDLEAQKPNLMDWILNRSGGKIDLKTMLMLQLNSAAASIHTTASTTSLVIYDLLARPEFIAILREEIEEVMKNDKVDSSGRLIPTKQSVLKLKKMDSFIKESQRLSPLLMYQMFRLAMKDVTLSTGHFIPAGSRIAFCSLAATMASGNPDFDPTKTQADTLPADQFDGLRFYKLRNRPGYENKHQFTSTSPDGCVFGHGALACPGRFFAALEIKMIMVEFLRNWDLRFPGDVEQEGGIERRPKNIEYRAWVIPSDTAEIELRRRKV